MATGDRVQATGNVQNFVYTAYADQYRLKTDAVAYDESPGSASWSAPAP